MTLLELKLPAHGDYEASTFVFQQDSVSCLYGSTGQIIFLTIQNTAMLKTDGICQVSSLDLPEGMSVEAAAKGFEENVPMTQKTEFLLNERTATLGKLRRLNLTSDVQEICAQTPLFETINRKVSKEDFEELLKGNVILAGQPQIEGQCVNLEVS